MDFPLKTSSEDFCGDLSRLSLDAQGFDLVQGRMERSYLASISV